MEKIKTYDLKTANSIEAVANGLSVLKVVSEMERKGNVPMFIQEDASRLIVDTTVKKVWRGFVAGKIFELQKDGYIDEVKDILKI